MKPRLTLTLLPKFTLAALLLGFLLGHVPAQAGVNPASPSIAQPTAPCVGIPEIVADLPASQAESPNITPQSRAAQAFDLAGAGSISANQAPSLQPDLPPTDTINPQKLTPEQQKAEDQAKASFITGILSLALLPFTYGLSLGLSIAAIVLANKARRNAVTPNAQRKARQGRIMGWVSLGIYLVVAALIMLFVLVLLMIW
jgi:hypothetical protein